jgi:hypothetical protein
MKSVHTIIVVGSNSLKHHQQQEMWRPTIFLFKNSLDKKQLKQLVILDEIVTFPNYVSLDSIYSYILHLLIVFTNSFEYKNIHDDKTVRNRNILETKKEKGTT